MVHAVRGFNAMWKHLPASHILYNVSDLDKTTFKELTSLNDSGLCPCLLVNIGSAMTIVGVSLWHKILRFAFYLFIFLRVVFFFNLMNGGGVLSLCQK